MKGHNTGTIGYVYVGGVDLNLNPKDTRTEAQKATMIRLSQEALRDYGIRKISGHRDYAAKPARALMPQANIAGSRKDCRTKIRLAYPSLAQQLVPQWLPQPVPA